MRSFQKRVFMAKSSVPRHSKSSRKSMTIELEPSSVSKPAATPAKVPEPEPVGFEAAPAAKPAAAAAPGPSAASGPKPGAPQSAAGKPVFGRTDPAADKPAAPASAAPSARTNDPLGRLAAGFIGGVVALVGAAGLQWAGILPSPRTDLSKLEQEIAQLRAAPAPSLDEGSRAALDGAAETSRQALDQVGTLSNEVNAVRQALADVQKQASAPGAPADTSALDARIAELEGQIKAGQQRAEQADGTASGAAQRLDALEAKVNDTSGQSNMALAMAATSLKAAVDRGEPFTAELDTYAAVAPDAASAEALRAGAATGVPPVSALAARFGDVAPRIIDSTRKEDPDAGVLDRLWTSASRLVEARPVGMVEGDGADAIAARIETHLNAGDLKAAIAEWDRLPESAKAVSADFGTAMKLRQSTSEAVSKALSGALTGIKAPSNRE
ncbi:MAG: COG4223 family protein, partial [Alphaproteobacteria bacterium]